MDESKFAGVEARVLINQHCSTLYQFFDRMGPGPLTPELKEAMLATVSRIYEIIEGYAEGKPPKPLH